MHTHVDPLIWIFSLSFFASLALVAGAVATQKQMPRNKRAIIASSLGFISFLVVIPLINSVETSIEKAEREASDKTVSFYENLELLANRLNLADGWYAIAEPPMITELFSNSGDTTKYVTLMIHTDCVGNLKVAFPVRDWVLPLPRIEEKYLGYGWTSIHSSYSDLKAVRIERYETKEFSIESRAVEAKF